eukprot:Hpha_TRINITY_DN15046_c0_g2::TRINITY_DN15046_c0_g2_i1::g.126032::m.126032/K07107/ybgC; acyl-CoA thioester hydrolase
MKGALLRPAALRARVPRRWNWESAAGKDHKALAEYPLITRVQVRWGDMDTFSHVNNIVYAQYLEQARCELMQLVEEAAPGHGFWVIPPGACSPILASQTLKYIRPMTAPDTFVVGTRVTKMAPDNFMLGHLGVSDRTGDVTLSAGKRSEMPKPLADALAKYAAA